MADRLKQAIFFDIESGGLDPDQSSVYSIGYSADGRNNLLAADPVPGTRMSTWAKKNILPKITSTPGYKPGTSEQSALRQFLSVLEQNKGSTLAGWNIGYDIKSKGAGARGSGFDIPYIMSRASKYNLDKQYSAAFSGMHIRDIAQETLFKLAPVVQKYKGLVDEELYKSMDPYAGIVHTIRSGLTGKGLSEDQIVQAGARQLAATEKNVAGWKLEQIHELMGLGKFTAHDALADIEATRNIFSKGVVEDSPEFVSRWNKGATLNALLKRAERGPFDGVREGFFNSLKTRAEKAGILDEFTSLLSSAGTLENAQKGISFFDNSYEYVKGARHLTGLKSALMRNKLPLGFAAAAIGLYALKPLSWFSGKDDDYNTIEGLKHGGEAQKMRKKMTEFGSGWDKLRALVKQHAGDAPGMFEKVTRSPEFTASLASGRVIKSLGEGHFGQVHLMETSVKIGDKMHTIQYARKHSTDSLERVMGEVKSMSKLQDLNAPSVYGVSTIAGGKQIYMEAFQGRAAKDIMMEGGTLSKEFITDLEGFLKTSHERGIAHRDLFRDVIKFHPSKEIQKELGALGEYIPHNIMVTPEGRAAVFDYGIQSSASQDALKDMYAQSFAGKGFETAAHYDMALVESLKANKGQMTTKAFETIGMEVPVTRRLSEQLQATMQKRAQHTLFENARSGGHKSKSHYAASIPTLPTER